MNGNLRSCALISVASGGAGVVSDSFEGPMIDRKKWNNDESSMDVKEFEGTNNCIDL